MLKNALVLCVAALCVTHAHAHPQVFHNVTCVTDNPTIYSYHIHVLFLPNNQSSVANALTLQRNFMETFNLIGKANCTGNAGDPFNKGDMELCAFPTTFAPDGPFVTGQYSFFVPLADLQRTMTWITQRRGLLDVFVHPNSGCEIEDHTTWALTCGNSWVLDLSQFNCDSPGCVPPH